MSGPLFSFRMIPTVAGMLAVRGIEARPLLEEAGLPDEALRGEVIAPLPRIQRFVELAAGALDNPLFGIDLAAQIPAGALGVTEFLMRSAPTVTRCLEMLCEFAPLINPILRFELDGRRLRFAVLAQREALGRHLNEYTFALMFRQFTSVLGERWPVEEMWFSHAPHAHAAAVAQRFGCRVELGAADCGFVVDRAVLDRSPPTADSALFEFLLAQARAQIGNLGTRDVISQVARVIETRLGTGSLEAEAIAKAMATTVRSLQRHLADAGTSYREVLQHVRQRRRAELVRSGVPEAEIARRLGFSDASTMRRSLDGSTQPARRRRVMPRA